MNLSYKQGFIDCVPTLMGYVGIGIAAGMIGKASNLSVLEVTFTAFFVYAGAAQFIMASLMMMTAPISGIILTVFLVNSRHLLMSMATAPYFKKYSILNNLGIGSLLTDETFAVTMTHISKNKPINASWMHGLNVTAYVVWILSCLFGALLGDLLPNPRLFGMDYALVAMFIGLLYLQFSSDGKRKIKTFFVMLSVVALVVLLMRYISAELAILTATLIGCLLGVMLDKGAKK